MNAPAGFTLVSHTPGGLPLVNHGLPRPWLEEFMQRHLPPPDPRAQLPPSAALGVDPELTGLQRTFLAFLGISPKMFMNA